MAHLDVATLNIRNIADRWPERLPLLLADMAALQPDLLGLQECVFAVGAGPPARRRRRWPLRDPPRRMPAGPSTATACSCKAPLAIAGATERLDLGRKRSALRVPVTISGGRGSWRWS